MTATLNYILEANLGLMLSLLFYFLFLRKETNFRIMRAYILAAIFASLLFPLMDAQLNANTAPLSLGRMLPSYWLPEVVVDGEGVSTFRQTSLGFWQWTAIVYTVGLILTFGAVCYQLAQLARVVRKSKTYRIHKLRVAESNENKPTFSFFNFIFIGKSNDLSPEEKKQIILHESVHARQWHSFDILLINLVRILFWFNPFTGTYKKILIQLHEFEADARAVEHTDVNKYCSLLARIALESADFKLANHFNNSLTIKRIEMMRTIKRNIKQWKVLSIAAALPLMFFVIACNDQVNDELKEITRNSSHALMVPEFVEQRLAELKQADPDKNYVVLELNEEATERISKLQSMYGLPQSVEIFTAADGKVVQSGLKGNSAAGVIVEKSTAHAAADGTQTFAIMEFNAEVSRISEEASGEDRVFTVVEQQPEYPGGYVAMIDFIRSNLRYPLEARQKGIAGTVYASFIVEKDGSISAVKIIRGISLDCDNEVKRMVQSFPKWTPAHQRGEVVRVRFVLPVKFALE